MTPAQAAETAQAAPAQAASAQATPVQTASAPAALPVRSTMLVRLAAERATGTLLREPGTLHLVDGRVVHAESPRSPGLDVLLVAGGHLTYAAWDEAREPGAGPLQIADRLVKDGALSLGELELCHLVALFDAAYFVLAPSGGPSRFRHGSGPVGPYPPCPVAVERLVGEVQRRRNLLDSLWPGPRTDALPVTRRPPLPEPAGPAPAPVPVRLRAVLELADGTRTAEDIAHVLGRPTFRVLLEVRRLAAAGLVDPGPPPAPPQTGGRRGSPTARPRAPDTAEAPEIALLRRVRAALEARL